jgi:hypothetical protein
MAGTRDQIEERILDLDSSGEHATDVELAEEFDVSDRWIGQIRHELYEAGEIEATSDFFHSPRSGRLVETF